VDSTLAGQHKARVAAAAFPFSPKGVYTLKCTGIDFSTCHSLLKKQRTQVFSSLQSMFRVQKGKNNPQKGLFKCKFYVFEDLDISRAGGLKNWV
jgi:hypothetical protein